ncbi:hypothetical protein [Flagellimonas meridianipacifica]|nr:hypothetical protein [Allomuricauda pacifica]
MFNFLAWLDKKMIFRVFLSIKNTKEYVEIRFLKDYLFIDML